MGSISFKVLNLILSNLDDKPNSIQPVEGYDEIYTVNFDNGEIAQVEVFPENEGINFHWVKVNGEQEILDKVYNDSKGEVAEFKGTKGKWKVDSYDNTLVRPDIRYTNEGICRCFSKYYTGNKFEEEANALLISKAPEMLGMLNRCLEMAKAVNAPIAAGEIQRLIKSATQI